MRALDDSCKVKGRGRPVPKKRKTSLPSLEYTRNGFSIRDQRLVLPKGFTVPAVWHRGLPSEPTSVRVYQDCLGHWYASFVVVRKTEPGPGTSGRVGIDWGVSRPATATDPSLDLPYSGHRKRCAAEVARQQRKMARRARRRGRKLHGPQSNGYKAAARQAARVLKKAARQQRHDARQWANSVVAVNDLLGVEDFKPT
jgi:putative transposase